MLCWWIVVEQDKRGKRTRRQRANGDEGVLSCLPGLAGLPGLPGLTGRHSSVVRSRERRGCAWQQDVTLRDYSVVLSCRAISIT